MAEYVIGFDLNDLVSQISFTQINTGFLKSVNSDNNDERLGIPTVLCKRNGVNQWYFGKEAETLAKRGDGTLVGKLISFAKAGARLEIEGEAYDPVDLLILFVKRSLNILTSYINPNDVLKLVFTVEILDDKMIDILEKIVATVSIPRDRIVFQTYDESVYYYTIHQPKDLWKNNVIIFDYSNEFLKSYEFHLNPMTTPVVGFVDFVKYTHFMLPKDMMEGEVSREKESRLDELFLQTVHDGFSGRAIGTVYLIGDGFDGDWFDKSKNYLCMGRKVYKGTNLYSKGACYCAEDKVTASELNKTHLFLGPDKLKGNTGLNMRVGGKDQYVVLVDAGETWYESDTTMEFILEDAKSVDIIVTPLDGAKRRIEEISLAGLPERPKRATRLRLEATFSSDTEMHVKVTDLGLGEFYLPSGKVFEKDIDLS